ncbi:unnamed protein product, partial [Choristocarpus tenellus]
RGRISFLYADGVAFADSMKTLGLFGSKERLPQIAFNTLQGQSLPFPEELPVNRETLLLFCSAYLSGQLQTGADVKKALTRTHLTSTHNTVFRKEVKKPSKEVQGVSEQFKPDDCVVQVTQDSFEEVVLNEEHDVLVMLHSQECEQCSHLVPYYKRVGKRFRDLGTPSVLVVSMDVTKETPPPNLGITLPTLPAILLLPAYDKGPPYRFFSGVGKAGPIMQWVHNHASLPFDLPNLPHLSEEDKPLFKKQVRERQSNHAT